MNETMIHVWTSGMLIWAALCLIAFVGCVCDIASSSNEPQAQKNSARYALLALGLLLSAPLWPGLVVLGVVILLVSLYSLAFDE